MKKPLPERISEFIYNKVVPLTLIGAALTGGGYICFQNHRLENSIVQNQKKTAAPIMIMGKPPAGRSWKSATIGNACTFLMVI